MIIHLPRSYLKQKYDQMSSSDNNAHQEVTFLNAKSKIVAFIIEESVDKISEF